MKINYIKTIGFRKFKNVFETELYDVSNITGKNRSGKSNILYAIVNIMLGTNLSGDEKACLINKNSDSSYGELHFTDNRGINHILVRGKNKYTSKGNFITLDGKTITQAELLSFYKDKKLFLSIINPLYFINKKPSEQKEMVDKYLSDIRPKVIFDRLDEEQQNKLIKKYFSVPTKDVYERLNTEELKNIYKEEILDLPTGKKYEELSEKELKDIILKYAKSIHSIRLFKELSPKEQEEFINLNMLNIFMDIAYNNLNKDEQKILEGVPRDIPTYISELNADIKKSENAISSLDGKIDYAQNIVNAEPPERKVFEKDEELTLARQEYNFLNTNQDIVDKEKQKQIVENLEKDILNKESEISELEREMKDGKKKYLAIKNGSSCVCPTCSQHIEDESKKTTISNMYNDLVAKYDKKNLLETQIKELKLNLSMEKCKFHALEGNTSIEKSKRITVVEENIKQLENEKLEVEKFNQEIETKEKLIKSAEADISNFNNQKQVQIKHIDNLNKAKKIAQKLYISYIEEKMKLAKEYLKDVDIKFYSVLKTTGEIKEDFIITYKDTPLSDLSRSETIATALEFANMFNKIARANFPIFVDDYESCADYDFIKEYSKDTQLIVSKVEKGNLLKIADGNSDKCTIIKPIITGFKTISIQKREIANISKVA